MTDAPTTEEIAAHYTAMGHSVALITDVIAGNAMADDDSWTHNATDISGEAASVQAIANAAWTDDVKAAYKAMREAQGS